MIDGEVVLRRARVSGLPRFAPPQNEPEAFLYAFDLLEPKISPARPLA